MTMTLSTRLALQHAGDQYWMADFEPSRCGHCGCIEKSATDPAHATCREILGAWAAHPDAVEQTTFRAYAVRYVQPTSRPGETPLELLWPYMV